MFACREHSVDVVNLECPKRLQIATQEKSLTGVFRRSKTSKIDFFFLKQLTAYSRNYHKNLDVFIYFKKSIEFQ